MLFGILAVLFVFVALLMILVILMQKGKGGLGLGSIGGSNQFLFGSTGGQDLFQKITWVLGAVLIFGSVGLAIWKTKQVGVSRTLLHQQTNQLPTMPSPIVDDV